MNMNELPPNNIENNNERSLSPEECEESRDKKLENFFKKIEEEGREFSNALKNVFSIPEKEKGYSTPQKTLEKAFDAMDE